MNDGSRALPTQQELDEWILGRSNWGRWGANDQVGAINLITPQKRVEAARLIRSGRLVSLARPLATMPAPNNPQPVQHFMKSYEMGNLGIAVDYLGVYFHGVVNTHLDALCHMWNPRGLFNNRDPKTEIGFEGARWGAVEVWGEGIVTRGVLLDIPRLRGQPFATESEPVHGWELGDALVAQKVELAPGDALCVYSGREAWQAAQPRGKAYAGDRRAGSPGLHASCLKFLRDYDVSILAWDMMDFAPSGYTVSVPMHAALFAYGVALVDNALLAPLAEACAAEGRWEFMFSMGPLKLVGGTGCPINPLAHF
jgi:kynurenine formamidase